MMFIDLEKAYDKIVRSQLWECLVSSLGLDEDIVERLKLLYNGLGVRLAEDIQK